MMDNNSFYFFRNAFLFIDRKIACFFGKTLRKRFWQFGYILKFALFSNALKSTPTKEIRSHSPASQYQPKVPLPDWVLEEMKAIGKEIDPSLYPNEKFLSKIAFYSFPFITHPGEVYAELMGKCTAIEYDYCFAIPWLKRGGADLIALRHIEFAAKHGKVLVLMTEDSDSPWAEKLPLKVDVLYLGEHSGLPFDELVRVIARLLVQLDIKVLHVINSHLLWECIRRHGLTLRQKTRLFASLFCDDYDYYGIPTGYGRQYLCETYANLTAVFSDNNHFPSELRSVYGFPESLFKTLKNPCDFEITSERLLHYEKKVIWAGRLDRQKRPDLLLAIAQRMPDFIFHVYGEPTLESSKKVLRSMKKTKNIILHGKFDTCESLPFNKFPVFLYTSQWDGIPNIILESAKSGIPIIASAVGGILEVINNDTGYPIRDIENIDSYVSSILHIFQSPDQAKIKAQKAQQYVINEHNRFRFETALKSVPGYFEE